MLQGSENKLPRSTPIVPFGLIMALSSWAHDVALNEMVAVNKAVPDSDEEASEQRHVPRKHDALSLSWNSDQTTARPTKKICTQAEYTSHILQWHGQEDKPAGFIKSECKAPGCADRTNVTWLDHCFWLQIGWKDALATMLFWESMELRLCEDVKDIHKFKHSLMVQMCGQCQSQMWYEASNRLKKEQLDIANSLAIFFLKQSLYKNTTDLKVQAENLHGSDAYAEMHN
jgi:hypothetical protein